jgi:PhoH-like ATPase
MKKNYVLDTNVLLSDPNSIFSFDDNVVLIPLVVLEELDNHKNRQDEIGKNARVVSRSLDDLRQFGHLMSGVELRNGGLLKVVSTDFGKDDILPRELNKSKVDNQLISLMLTLDKDSILVTKDINVRLKCDSLGILCEDYLKMRVTDNIDTLYTGVKVVQVEREFIDDLYSSSLANLVLKSSGELIDFYPNQILVLKCGESSSSAIVRVVDVDLQNQSDICLLLKKVPNTEQVFGLKPRNKEQNFSLDLLLDEKIKLVTLVGPSGTGKTLLAIAAALQQVKDLGSHGTYDKLIITRPIQTVGKDIGFLPGTLEEKMQPWVAPIKDNLNFLMSNFQKNKVQKVQKSQPADSTFLSMLQEKGLIEVEAITYIRGRSIPNSIMIIDEAQNLSMHELKTIITRAGDNTKIILTGDIEQIDNVHVDIYSNGLTYAIEKFKEYQIAAHVTLIKGERSELATLASKIL